jgi:DNA-cytosine methyltransferase
MLNVLSLFSGIGAFEKALENLGIAYNLIGYCEIDKYASKAYSLIHKVPEDMNYGDITQIDETQLPTNLDLLTYGFPCQDISIAGAKRGLVDEEGRKTRSGLFFDALRIIEATKPKIAIAENVKHLTSKSMKPVFDIVLTSLEEAGYNNYWQVMNCADYEIPQSRERVLIVSIRKDLDDGSFTFPAAVPLTKCLNDFLEDDVPEAYFLSEDKTQSVIRHDSNHPGHIADRGGICPTLLSRDYKDPKVVICSMKIKQVADLNHYGNDQMNRIYGTDGLCPTLKTVSGGGREVKIFDGERYRKLTQKEYFRLMGFSDADVELLENNGISKTQIYKMAGNSIPVKMLEHLFKAVYPKKRVADLKEKALALLD